MMFNPYLAGAGALAFIAAIGGAYVKGGQDATNAFKAGQLTQLTKALDERDAKQTIINALETEKAKLETLRQAAVRENYHETTRIIERAPQIYRNVCVDADGVGVLDRAQAIASGDAGHDSGAPAGTPGKPAESPKAH